MNELGLSDNPTTDMQDGSSIDISLHLCCGLKGTCAISVWDLEKNTVWNPTQHPAPVHTSGVAQVSRQNVSILMYLIYSFIVCSITASSVNLFALFLNNFAYNIYIYICNLGWME